MPFVNPKEARIAGRVLEYLRPNLPWNRRLWSPGSLLALGELLEAVSAVADSILSPESLRELCRQIHGTSEADPGLGDREARAHLHALLKVDQLRPRSLSTRAIAQLLPTIRAGYFRRWAEALSRPDTIPSVERSARCLASHLVDSGFSQYFLQTWWLEKCRDAEPNVRLAEILIQAGELLSQAQTDFRVLLPLLSVPRPPPAEAEGWMEGAAVNAWLREHGYRGPPLRVQGALLLRCEARDAWGAADVARDVAERIQARSEVGGRYPMRLHTEMWVKGASAPFPVLRPSRGIEVHSLSRERKVFDLKARSSVDDALHLVSYLDKSPPSVAVTNGWAAIESLFIGRGEGVERRQAADRLAAVVACSFPRAELTTLSYSHSGADTLAEQLAHATSNKERCQCIADHLLAGRTLSLRSEADRVAEERARSILADPAEVLRDVQSHVSAAVQRIYRHRNLVMHGGMIDGVVLAAALRTGGPLIAAGLDRVVHSLHNGAINAMEVAARAHNGLASLSSSRSRNVLELLE